MQIYAPYPSDPGCRAKAIQPLRPGCCSSGRCALRDSAAPQALALLPTIHWGEIDRRRSHVARVGSASPRGWSWDWCSPCMAPRSSSASGWPARRIPGEPLGPAADDRGGRAGSPPSLLGGVALLLGVWTRIVAALLTADMVVAILTVHLRGGSLSRTGGEFVLTSLGGCLALVGLGAGPGSVDGAGEAGPSLRVRRQGRRSSRICPALLDPRFGRVLSPPA